MPSIEKVVQRLNELGNFEYLTPALFTQIDFLNNRPRILAHDLSDPGGLMRSMAHEVAETFMPRFELESSTDQEDREIAKAKLASESADIVVFGLSALMAKDDWETNELNLIQDSFEYAEFLATLGDFELSTATVEKIKLVNSQHYPKELFNSDRELPFQMVRMVCRGMRVYFGSRYWIELGEGEVRRFLREVAADPDGGVPSTWNVKGQLDPQEYLEFKQAANQLAEYGEFYE